MKYKDVIGMKFGKLTIIEELPRIKNSKENQTFRIVKCKCDCGNVIDIKLVYLTRSHNPRRSCGCLHSESQKNRKSKRNDKFKNLEGLKFNKLTVIKFLGKNSDKYKNNNMWGCICDCGNIKQVSTSALIHSKINSCGKCTIYGSLGEEKIRSILRQNNIAFEEQYKYDDLYFKDSRYKLRFDFCVNNEYLIEYDGEQHFKARKTWGRDTVLKETQYRDELKNEYCRKNGIPLIRIPYWRYNDLKLEDLLLETSEFLVI